MDNNRARQFGEALGIPKERVDLLISIHEKIEQVFGRDIVMKAATVSSSIDEAKGFINFTLSYLANCVCSGKLIIVTKDKEKEV